MNNSNITYYQYIFYYFPKRKKHIIYAIGESNALRSTYNKKLYNHIKRLKIKHLDILHLFIPWQFMEDQNIEWLSKGDIILNKIERYDGEVAAKVKHELEKKYNIGIKYEDFKVSRRYWIKTK
jgi:hypothetical protein